MFQQMKFARQSDPPPPILTPVQCKALRLLSEAWLAAHLAGQDVWQFAVEIDQLYALGLNYTDLRSLLCWDYLEHAQERTTAAIRHRVFLRLKALILPKRTCFVLTAKGRQFVAAIEAQEGLAGLASKEGPSALPSFSAAVPHWDSSFRQLGWQNYVIKEFRRPAVNQELVLAALEEEGWPPLIADPLPPLAGIDPKTRLHDTIKALNRHHLYRLIRFRGDGTGSGIRWIAVGR